jgi:Protein of unknown function (DUF4446)
MSLTEWVGIVALALAVVLAVVVVVQTVRLNRVESHLRALTRGAGPGATSLALGDLLARQAERLEAAREETESLRNAVATLDVTVARSVQNVALVRFNPFQDTGGDQSFALALLDRRGDGVVMSSLHSRTSTRFYAKPVKGGTSQLSLSDEEAQAVQQAMARKSG